MEEMEEIDEHMGFFLYERKEKAHVKSKENFNKLVRDKIPEKIKNNFT